MYDLVLDHERRREVSEALGLSFSRARAVRRVARGPMSMSELAAALGIDPPNATVLVDELEAQGLVRRTASHRPAGQGGRGHPQGQGDGSQRADGSWHAAAALSELDAGPRTLRRILASVARNGRPAVLLHGGVRRWQLEPLALVDRHDALDPHHRAPGTVRDHAADDAELVHDLLHLHALPAERFGHCRWPRGARRPHSR